MDDKCCIGCAHCHGEIATMQLRRCRSRDVFDAFRIPPKPAAPKRMADISVAKTIGYYTVVQDDRMGWTGGLLVLNSRGRPLEFQCTLPVRPSKAHEILYGPTLRAHLIGEIIGGLLLKKARTPLTLLCCDQAEALSLENLVDLPVALVGEAAERDEGPVTAESLSGSQSVEFAGTHLWVGMEHTEKVAALADAFQDIPDGVEPFDRIREAIKEAHSQIARQQTGQSPERGNENASERAA